MPTLLLYKLSTFEHLDVGIQKPSSEIHRFRRAHRRHYAALAKIEWFLKENKIVYRKFRRGQKVRYADYDRIITVGGDGTFLEAAQQAHNQIVLGVNSDPRLSVGRFCAATAENFPKILRNFFSNQAQIIALERLDIRLDGHPIGVRALNDILVCHSNPAAMSHYVLQIGRNKEEQRSSGIWIATAAGSTGGIHSAGGKRLKLTSPYFQYMPRELYCGWGGPRRLTGSILKKGQRLVLTSLMRDGVFFVDGAHRKFKFSFGQKIVISIARQPLMIVKP